MTSSSTTMFSTTTTNSTVVVLVQIDKLLVQMYCICGGSDLPLPRPPPRFVWKTLCCVGPQLNRIFSFENCYPNRHITFEIIKRIRKLSFESCSKLKSQKPLLKSEVQSNFRYIYRKLVFKNYES